MSDTEQGSDASDNQRTFTRIFFDAETVLTQGDNVLLVQLIDIAFKGILVRLLPGQQVDPGQTLDATIHLGGDIQICMNLNVANQHEDMLGLRCNNIDLDSLTHLRRLVELNLGDISLLERELSALQA